MRPLHALNAGVQLMWRHVVHAVLAPPPHCWKQCITAHWTLVSKQATHPAESIVVVEMQFFVPGSCAKFCWAQLVTSVWSCDAPICAIFA
jgi:hypothetical protein